MKKISSPLPEGKSFFRPKNPDLDWTLCVIRTTRRKIALYRVYVGRVDVILHEIPMHDCILDWFELSISDGTSNHLVIPHDPNKSEPEWNGFAIVRVVLDGYTCRLTRRGLSIKKK